MLNFVLIFHALADPPELTVRGRHDTDHETRQFCAAFCAAAPQHCLAVENESAFSPFYQELLESVQQPVALATVATFFVRSLLAFFFSFFQPQEHPRFCL